MLELLLIVPIAINTVQKKPSIISDQDFECYK
jgi:hypothetical protein